MILIRPWQPDDSDELRPLIGAMLRTACARGADLLDTPRNVERLLAIGSHWAERGRPCLVAVDGGVVVGYVEWGWDDPPPFDLRWRTCIGLGTYVHPDYRHHGVAHELREQAQGMCAAAGIERVTGQMVLRNAVGMQDMLNDGWQARTVNLELHLHGEVMPSQL